MVFNDIGGKMKFFAKITTWIGIVFSVFVGLVLCAIGIDERDGGSLIWGGIALMFFGSAASFVGSWFLYGFGELIENSCIQTELLLRMEKRNRE